MRPAASHFLGISLLLLAAFGQVRSAQGAPVCVLGMVPCWLDCHSPPPGKDLAGTAAIIAVLPSRQYAPVTRLDQWTGFITTPFKCLGLNGWRQYPATITVIGIVRQAATSTDGLRTLDLSVTYVDGQQPPVVRYARAEVIRCVWARLDHPPRCGDRIRVTGRLHWDGHGFLEVHPKHKGDVTILGP